MLKIDEVCKRIPVCALYSKSVQKIVQSSRWWIKWISSSQWNLCPNHMMRQLQMFASGNWYFCLGYWNYWKGGSIFLKTRACERGTTSSRLKFYESKSRNCQRELWLLILVTQYHFLREDRLMVQDLFLFLLNNSHFSTFK